MATSRIKGAREESHSKRPGEWPLQVECHLSEYLPVRNSPPSRSYGLQERATGTCDDPEGKNRIITCLHYPPMPPFSARASLWLSLIEIREVKAYGCRPSRSDSWAETAQWNFREGKRGSGGQMEK